jgi:hypothetical protein
MTPYQLSEKWRLASDASAFLLQKLIPSGKQGMVWSTQGWYGSVAEALKDYSSHAIRESPATLPEALSTAVSELRRAASELGAALTVTL